MSHPQPRGYFPGDYKVICDVTGIEMLRSECVLRWDGLLVRRDAVEARHPLDFIRVRTERAVPRDPRPEGEDINVPPQVAWLDLPDATGNAS